MIYYRNPQIQLTDNTNVNLMFYVCSTNEKSKGKTFLIPDAGAISACSSTQLYSFILYITHILALNTSDNNLSKQFIQIRISTYRVL